MFSQNHLANKVHCSISLYLKACGTVVKAFDTMSTLGVTMSQKWALNALEKLVKNKMADLVSQVRMSSFHVVHNNINQMSRVSHQQVNHNSHFESGTVATIFIPPYKASYRLPMTNKELLRKTAEGVTTLITLHKIKQLHADTAPRIFSQNVYMVLQILVDVPGFKFDDYEDWDSEVFKHPPVSEALPTGPAYTLRQFVVETTQINKATYDGNEQFISELFCQLGLDTDKEKVTTGLKWIIIWSGNQLATSRLRGLKAFHSMDKDPYEELCWMEPIFGWFHLQMAFAMSLHK